MEAWGTKILNSKVSPREIPSLRDGEKRRPSGRNDRKNVKYEDIYGCDVAFISACSHSKYCFLSFSMMPATSAGGSLSVWKHFLM